MLVKSYIRLTRLGAAIAALLILASSCAEGAGTSGQTRTKAGSGGSNKSKGPDDDDDSSADARSKSKSKSKNKSKADSKTDTSTKTTSDGGEDITLANTNGEAAVLEFPTFKFNGQGDSICGQMDHKTTVNVTTNYTITTGRNAMTAGPITINSGITVTIPTGQTWTIV